MKLKYVNNIIMLKKWKRHRKTKQTHNLEEKINQLERELQDTENAKEYIFCCGICEMKNGVPQLNTNCGHTYCNN